MIMPCNLIAVIYDKIFSKNKKQVSFLPKINIRDQYVVSVSFLQLQKNLFRGQIKI